MDVLLAKGLSFIFQHATAEQWSLVFLLLIFTMMLTCWRLGGLHGLYLYQIVAIVAANIQVLKTATFVFLPHPMALGTLLFASTCTASDIITEHEGVEAAKRGIYLSMAAQCVFALWMLFALAYPTSGTFNGEGNVIQSAFYQLFLPSSRLIVASLLSFYVSQRADVYVFSRLRAYTHGRALWLRTNASSMMGALLDTLCFSVLAWQIFSPHPVNIATLVWTYMFGAMLARALVSLLSTPVLYWSRQ